MVIKIFYFKDLSFRIPLTKYDKGIAPFELKYFVGKKINITSFEAYIETHVSSSVFRFLSGLTIRCHGIIVMMLSTIKPPTRTRINEDIDPLTSNSI